jgi:predicted RNase H-like HicB family nuclease
MTKEEALENIYWALMNYLSDNPSEKRSKILDKSFNKIKEEIHNED